MNWHKDIINDRPEVNRPFIVASRYNDCIGLDSLAGHVTYAVDSLVEPDDKMLGEDSATSDIVAWSYFEPFD